MKLSFTKQKLKNIAIIKKRSRNLKKIYNTKKLEEISNEIVDNFLNIYLNNEKEVFLNLLKIVIFE